MDDAAILAAKDCGEVVVVGWGSGQDLRLLFTTIGSGFGGLLGKIGLIIVFGAILGVILEKTGGAVTLADALINTLGKRFPALTMAVVGAIVSIPVFCDSGFIILSRLNRRLAARTGVAPASLFLALAAGLYLTHNLVPPTPGPVTAAAYLSASQYLGSIMLIGLLVSVPILLMAWWWSRRQGGEIVLGEEGLPDSVVDVNPPSLWRVLPSLLIPIVLLALGTIWQDQPIWQVLGQAPISLLLGVLWGFLLLAWPQRREWSKWTAHGIGLAGPVLIITGLGGSFGAVLIESGVEEVVRELFADVSGSKTVLLVSAFVLAAILKTAQGSSTSALVVSSAVLAPVVGAVGFTDPLSLSLLVTTIGSGAMAVSHANDSYFWVVTQFSNLSVKDAYRSYSIMTLLMGLTGLSVCLLLNFLL